MWPYLLLFSISAWGALTTRPRRWTQHDDWIPLAAVGLILTLMIGFRYQVGADWVSYLNRLYFYGRADLRDIWTFSDPGYSLVNWLAYRWGLGVWVPNLVCGAIFSGGLVIFCRRQPQPMLAMLVAIPYLGIVVAMGYSRQGAAIGFVMMALIALRDQRIIRFIVMITLATTFHSTAALMVPVGLASFRRYRLIAWTAGIPAGFLLYTIFLQEKVDTLIYIYIDAQMESQGALIRVFMNALPALLFLVYRPRFHLPDEEERLWTIIALISLGLVLLLFVLPSSTAVDRIGLYFVPLQIFVLARLPLALARSASQYTMLVLAILGYLAAVLLVWMIFSSYASLWVPYRIFPLHELRIV